jgi:hypothetical protein
MSKATVPEKILIALLHDFQQLESNHSLKRVSKISSKKACCFRQKLFGDLNQQKNDKGQKYGAKCIL